MKSKDFHKGSKLNFNLIGFAFCLVVMGCSSSSKEGSAFLADRQIASDQVDPTDISAPPHVVFFIHGYRDNGSAWADFPKLIAEKYAKQNVRVRELSYPSVGNAVTHDLQAYQFARVVKAQIISFLIEQKKLDLAYNKAHPEAPRKYTVGLDTSYTLVGHSQGGLVALNYLNSCFVGTMMASRGVNRCSHAQGLDILEKTDLTKQIEDENLGLYPKFYESMATPENVRNLVTFGSPIWGSPMASALESKGQKTLTDYIRDKVPVTQTENLATGGRTTSLIRTWMVNRPPPEMWDLKRAWTSRYGKRLRVFNVAGYIGDLTKNNTIANMGVKMLFNPADLELDLVVAASEARADFFFNLENPIPGMPNFVGRTHLSNNYAPINAVHTPFLDLPALTDVRRGPTAEEHPAMIYLSNILNRTLAELAQAKRPVGDDSFVDAREGEGGEWIDGLFSQEQKEKFFMQKVSNFTNEFKLVTPIGYHRKFVIDEKKVQILPEKPSVFELVKMPDAIEAKVSGYNSSALRIRHNYYQTYFHSGKFKEEFSFFPIRENFPKNPEGYNMNYVVNVFGFEPSKFMLKTLPSFNSYGEFFLKPYLPFTSRIEKVGGNTFVAGYKSKDRVRIFSLDPLQKLQVTELSSQEISKDLRPLLDRCQLGLRGLDTPLTNEALDYIGEAHERRLSVKHEGKLYQEVTDTETQEAAKIGEAFEILGRYTTGFIDPASRVGRECTDPEIAEREERGDMICKQQSVDRYLVTSTDLRKQDGVSFSALVPGKGLRWINVVDVDAATEALPVFKDSFVNSYPLYTADRCIKDEANVSFQAPQVYADRFYNIVR